MKNLSISEFNGLQMWCKSEPDSLSKQAIKSVYNLYLKLESRVAMGINFDLVRARRVEPQIRVDEVIIHNRDMTYMGRTHIYSNTETIKPNDADIAKQK